MKDCTHLVYTVWLVWTYANTYDPITTTKVIDIPNIFQTFHVSLCFCHSCVRICACACTHTCMCVWVYEHVRTLNMIIVFLTDFEVHSTVGLTINTMLQSTSLERTHFAYSKLYIHWITVPPAPGNHYVLYSPLLWIWLF